MEDLIKNINKFRDDRNWRQFHNEKDLAISISLEANEFLELFQWKTSDEAIGNTERLQEELADVFIYSFMMADNLGFDVKEIIGEKLAINELKYPIEKCIGKNSKYTDYK